MTGFITREERDEAVSIAKQRWDDPEAIQLAIDISDAYEAEGRQRQSATRKLFQDRETHGLPQETLQEISRNYAGNQDRKYKVFNDLFFREFGGIDQGTIEAEGSSLRKQYALRTWGEEITDDKAFADRLASDFDFEDSIAERARMAAFLETPPLQALGALESENGGNPVYSGRRNQWIDSFSGQAREIRQRISPYRTTVASVVSQLQGKTGTGQTERAMGAAGAKRDPERDDPGSYRDLAEILMGVPKEDRDFVISAIIARGTNGDAAARKFYAQKLAENFGRGVMDYAHNIPAIADRGQALLVRDRIAEGFEVPSENTGTAEGYLRAVTEGVVGGSAYKEARILTGAMGKDWSGPGEDVQAEAAEMAERMVEAVDLRQRLRFIAENDIDPATSENVAARGFLQAARSIPYTLASIAPGGFALNSAMMAETSYQTLRQHNPEMTARQAQAIAGFSGPLQAVVERVSGRVLTGRLPAFQRFANQAVVTQGAAARRFGARLGAATGIEMVQENVQDITPYFVQGAFSALSQDVPEVPWEDVFGDMARNQTELFFAVLPLALIGAGAGTVNDFRGARDMIGNHDLLKGSGVSEAAASDIRAAAIAGDFDRAQALLRQAHLEGGQDQKGMRENIADAIPAMIENRERVRELVNKAGDLDMIPAIRNDGNTWALEFNDGSGMSFNTYEEADARRWQVAEEEHLSLHVDTVSTIRQIDRDLNEGREMKYLISLEAPTLADKVASGEATEEQALQRMEIAEETGPEMRREFDEATVSAGLAGSTAEDRLATTRILGESVNEFRDEVVRTTVRLYQGATPFTLIEEKAEGDAKFMIQHAGMRRWMLLGLRDWERTTGDRLFRTDDDGSITDQDLAEAWSAMAQSYFVGRSRKGDLGPVMKQGRDQYAKALRSPLGSSLAAYANLLRSVYRRAATVEKARRDGTLDEDLEHYLAKSVGMSEQRIFEREVAKEGAGIADQISPELSDNASSRESVGGNLGGTTFSVLPSASGSQADIEALAARTFSSDSDAKAAGFNYGPLFRGDTRRVDEFTEGGGGHRGNVPGAAYLTNSLRGAWWYATHGGIGEYMTKKERAALRPDLSPSITRLFIRLDNPFRGGIDFDIFRRAVEKVHGPSGIDSFIQDSEEAFEAEMEDREVDVRLALEQSRDVADYAGHDTEAFGDNNDLLFLFADWEVGEEYLKLAGHDGVAYRDAEISEHIRRDVETVVPLHLEQVALIRPSNDHSAPGRSGAFIPETTFSILPAQDAEYLELAKDPEANREKLQEMVDEAASRSSAGKPLPISNSDLLQAPLFWRLQHANLALNPDFRSSNQNDSSQEEDGLSVWPSLNELLENQSGGLASYARGEVEIVAIHGEEVGTGLDGEPVIKPTAEAARFRHSNLDDFLRSETLYSAREMSSNANELDSIDEFLEAPWGWTRVAELTMEFDPVTYDENGKVIPLSQRFDSSRDEITYSILPGGIDLDNEFARMFSPFHRSPVLRAKLGQEMQRRVAGERRKLDEVLRANRPLKDIRAERRRREEEAFGNRLGSLDAGDFAALEAADLGDSTRPILSELLRRKSYVRKDGKAVGYWTGSLMSKSEAERLGIETRGKGEWDDIPDGLPSYVWGGSLAPDQAASMFGFESVAEFWDALSSEISSWQARKAEGEAVSRKVAEFRREAREEAKAWEADAIREKKTVGGDRSTLLAFMRTLDAIHRALPAEVRGRIGGFVALAKLKEPGAMLNEIERRINKVDVELEKWMRDEAEKRRRKLWKKAQPKRESGKKPKGKLGADIHDLFDTLNDALLWDGDEAEAHASMLEAKIAGGELTAEQEAHAQIEANLVRLFSDWGDTREDTGRRNAKGHRITRTVRKGADAARRIAAIEAAEEVWQKGYMAERERAAKERERREAIRQGIRKDTGKLGNRAQRIAKAKRDAGFFGKLKDSVLPLLNFEQTVGFALGDGSMWGRQIVNLQREAEYQKIDEVQAVLDGIESLFTKLGGSRLKGDQLFYRLSQPSFDTGQGGMMSEMEGLTAMMFWRQEDGKRSMLGKRDDAGNVTSTWSYDQSFVDEISRNLSDEAWAILDYLTDQYGGEWETLNPIFREQNGINLPRHANYSPLRKVPQQAQGNQTSDPVTGTTMSASSRTPGSLRTRAQVIAEPDFVNAIELFIAHKKELAHWKAFAKFNTEVQAILGNREVSNSIAAKGGEEAMSQLRSWMDYFAQGGVRDAGAHFATNKLIDRVIGRGAAMALVGRAGTLAIQATQLGAAAAKMPLGSYMLRMSKLLTGNMGWGEAMRSDYIQRRLKQMPPHVRIAMDGLNASNPTKLKHAVRKLGETLPGADALFTAGTFAMVLDYQYSQLVKAGVDPATAREMATKEAERITDEIAQPTREGARSLMELTNKNPMGRMAWAFSSEARKNLALVAYSAMNRTPVETARALLYTVAINGIMAAVIRTAWRDARDDEDDEWFDEKHWSLPRMALAVATEPLYGFPALGELAQDAIYAAAGEWKPSGTIIDAPVRAPGAIADILAGEGDSRDVETILMTIGLGSESAAAAASLMHIYRDAEGLIENLTN